LQAAEKSRFGYSKRKLLPIWVADGGRSSQIRQAEVRADTVFQSPIGRRRNVSQTITGTVRRHHSYVHLKRHHNDSFGYKCAQSRGARMRKPINGHF
jgi:hypothetical protein